MRRARSFPNRRISLLGEIIHNPEVNAQLAAMGIRYLPAHPHDAEIQDLAADDVVIVPAFGAEVATVEAIKMRGCQIVDTTCGDVMSVWKRVRQNASEQVTSIIHGKSAHEETMATASRALGRDGKGHYLVVLDLDQTDIVCDYIRDGGDKAELPRPIQERALAGFRSGYCIFSASASRIKRRCSAARPRKFSAAFAPRSRRATDKRRNFRFFDTICGATQERQDALFRLLDESLDLLVVVGGYNSSNTTHLAEIGEKKLPTWFIRNASCMISAHEIRHFDIHKKEEVTSTDWLPSKASLSVGITAGASCPNNLIEETINRLLALRNEPPFDGA